MKEAIVVEVGSHAKGYAVQGSDYDYIQIVPCSREMLLDLIFDRSRMTNRHTKIGANDVTVMNLFTALRGLYTGKQYELGVFATRDNVADERLFAFVRKLTSARLPLIFRAMAKFRVKNNKIHDPKSLLGLLYNLSYVDYYFEHNRLAAETPLSRLVGEEHRCLFDALIHKRLNGLSTEACEVDAMEAYRARVLARIDQMAAVPARDATIEMVIVDHFLNDRDLVMPDGKQP
nr:HE65B [Calliteara abietis nucleopolyhedrovirus]